MRNLSQPVVLAHDHLAQAPDGLASTVAYAAAFLARYQGGTRTLYDRHLGEWFTWCLDRGLDPLGHDPLVTRLDVESYIQSLMAYGLKPSTVGTMMGPVNGLYKLAHNDGLIPRNPTVMAWTPKVDKNRTHLPWIDRLELARWIKTSQSISPRHWATATLTGILGLRASEVANLRIEDISHDNGHQVIDFIGKGNKRAVMPLTVPIQRSLIAACGDRHEGPVITARGRLTPLTRCGISGLVATISRRAGTIPLSPHQVRSSCITAALDAGIPMRDVQALARHTYPSTTVLYDRNSQNLDRHAAYALSAMLAA